MDTPKTVISYTIALEYFVRLSRALRVLNLTHPLHDVLATVALLQVRDGYATLPGVALALGCTFNNVQIHVHRNPELFSVDGSYTPRRIEIQPEGVAIMDKLKKGISHPTL